MTDKDAATIVDQQPDQRPEPTVHVPAAPTDGAPVIAGYDLVRIIGRGGMGVVWEAIEHRLDRRVALKVHKDGWTAEKSAHMWSEARLAAKVVDPGVVAVHDLGYALDGTPYYTMDLVDGTDLRALIREGAIPQARALGLAIEIVRAVAAAHERGIVHRDLKPANILIDATSRARVLDFGLAFTGAQDLFVDRLCGTPQYMSPEQARGEAVGAESDIHALGILIYEMLTGVRPFDGPNTFETMELIKTIAPALPTTRAASIHPDVERTIMRCLEKNPADRFPNARALATALEDILEGRPAREVHVPAISLRRSSSLAPPDACHADTHEEPLAAGPSREKAPIHFRWEWTLRNSPAELWPHVANTERINKAAGLSPVKFTDAAEPGGGSTRTGAFRTFGMEIEWVEQPFEWVHNRRHSVKRIYRKGPFEVLWNQVTLTPTSDGTTLVHEIWIEPRGVLGRVVSHMEIARKLKKNLDRVYRRIDEKLKEPGGADPFEVPNEPTEEQRRYAATAAEHLVARGFEPAEVARLTTYLLCEPARRIERLRPYAIADRWEVPRLRTLDLFLHAANEGLLDLVWDLICPTCMTSHESFSGLACIGNKGVCTPCGTSYESDLAESIELVFQPHPALRPVLPETYCAGAPALRPHILAQQLLAPGETRVIEIELPREEYRVAASKLGPTWDFSTSPAGFVSACHVHLSNDVIDARPSVLRSGAITFTLVNATSHTQAIRVEVPGVRRDGVSAAVAMTQPAFRDFFSREILAEHTHVSVRRMAFLFLELENRSALFQEKGDAGAWEAFRRIDALIDEQLRAHRGVLVPAPLGMCVVAFSASASAVRSALAILEAAKLDSGLRVAVHEGQCIALTRDGRMEYFGKTLHRGAALLLDAPTDGVALSVAVASGRDVARLIAESRVPAEVTTTAVAPYAGLRVTKLRPRS